MPSFWIFQAPEYPRVLNIPRFRICQGSEYTRVLNTLGLCIRFLNVPEYPWIIPKYALLCLNIAECWTLIRPVLLRLQFVIFGNSAKKYFHYFRKPVYHRCLRKMWISLRSWIYQDSENGSGSEYVRVLYKLGI